MKYNSGSNVWYVEYTNRCEILSTIVIDGTLFIKQGKRFYNPNNHTYHRYRRNKLVEIPSNMVGNVTSKKTIRDRPSKQIRKIRNLLKYKKPIIKLQDFEEE